MIAFPFLPSGNTAANSGRECPAFIHQHTGRDVPSRDIGASAFARVSGKLGSGTGYGALLESEQLPARFSRRAAEAGTSLVTDNEDEARPGQRLDGPHGEMAE